MFKELQDDSNKCRRNATVNICEGMYVSIEFSSDYQERSEYPTRLELLLYRVLE